MDGLKDQTLQINSGGREAAQHWEPFSSTAIPFKSQTEEKAAGSFAGLLTGTEALELHRFLQFCSPLSLRSSFSAASLISQIFVSVRLKPDVSLLIALTSFCFHFTLLVF